MKRIIFSLIFMATESLVWAQTSYTGILTHTNSYFVIKPYDASYDDGSYLKSYYDGKKKRWILWNSDASTQYTDIQAGSMFLSESFGVGTSTPSSFVHIKSGSSGGSPHSYSRVTLEHDNHAMFSILTPNNKVAYYGFSDPEDDFVGGMQYNHTSDKMTFRVNNHDTDLVIDKDGNVGIGTNLPGSRLTVEDNSVDLALLKLKNKAWVSNQRTSIEFWNGGSKSYPTSRIVSKMDGSGSHGEALLFETQTAGTTDPSTKMIIKNNGNVGIGKLSPTAKLHVDGNIISEEVKVQDVDGADFVFAPDYDLMSLAEIEIYVKEHQHLPEVPSAKEMEANGVELGKMNMLLLQKIEEMTLLMINQQKEIKALKEEVTQLKNKGE